MQPLWFVPLVFIIGFRKSKIKINALPDARADVLMVCFGLNSLRDYPDYVNMNIRDKVSEIGGFLGVLMGTEFREEYDEWMEMEECRKFWKKVHVAIRRRNGRVSQRRGRTWAEP